MATVKAIIRTTKKNAEVNIRFRLSDGRNIQLFHNSEIKVNSDLWDAKNDCLKKRALCDDEMRNTINKAVNDRKALIQSVYNSKKEKCRASECLERFINESLHPETSKMQTNDFFSVMGLYLDKHPLTKNSFKCIHTVKNALLRYEYFMHETFNRSFNLSFDMIDSDFMDDFKSFLRNEGDLYKEYPNILQAIRKKHRLQIGIKNKGDNTIYGIFNSINTFLNWCVKEKCLKENPISSYEGNLSSKYTTPYYITLEERNHIANFDISSSPRLEIQRDIFVFQCLVGTRVSDLLNMTTNSVINDAIEYIPRKTKNKRSVVIRVPLNERARKLVSKYEGVDKKDRLFPFSILECYNKDIKEIFKICGITRLVTVLNPTTGEEEKRPINEVASSHMARRTFVGNLYKKVKDPNLVGALSGHVEGSRAFARYREIDEDMKKEVVALIE